MYLLLLLGSSFLDEVFNSHGKKAIQKRKETVYALGFLNSFGGIIAFGILALAGSAFTFQVASLPTLVPRIFLEIIHAQLVMRAIAIADRTTFSFFGLLSIPMLVVADVLLKFQITTAQVIGVLLITAILLSLLHDHSIRSKGAGLLLTLAAITPINISLFKYDVAHFNSVVAEQIIVISFILAYFWVMCNRKGVTQPWRLIMNPVEGAQTSIKGVSLVLKGFAFSMGPGSVIAVIGHTLGLVWSIIFGRKYFHEKHLGHKMFACFAASIALLLIQFS